MAAAATDAARVGAATPRADRGNRLTGLIVAFPELAICAVAGFSLGPMMLLLAGHFSPVPVFVTGVLGAVLAIAVRLRGLEPSAAGDGAPHAVGSTLAAVGVVVAWFAANVGFSAQNVYATRDPATYDITARWLMNHASLHIYTHPEIFGFAAGCPSTTPQPDSCFGGGAGFSPVDANQVYSQGNHLMPALAAVGGWMFGVDGLFKTNVLLGALALLALFALARRVAGGPAAVLVVAVMGVSMPMIYVSRDTYSEPLMMLFLIGGLSLLHRAVGSGRPLDFGLAGFVAGCSAMVRIDSYGALLSIIAAAIAVAGLAGPGRRRRACLSAVLLTLGAGIPTFLGWLDVTRLSYGYYRDQRHNIVLELAGALVLMLVGIVIVIGLWRPPVRAWLGRERTRVRLNGGLAVLVVVAFAVLASRPLWLVGHGAYNHTLASWQHEAGATVDGTRTYAEQTVSWLAEYFGWPTVIVAVGGYVLLIAAVLRRRDHRLIGLLLMGLSMSALYLWNSQISPDQPWAMRRYVPVVLPVLLVAFAAMLRWLWRRDRVWVRTGVVAVAAIAVIVPLAVSRPLWKTREENGQYAQVQAICRTVGSDGAVVEIDGDALAAYGQTMRSYCDVPSLGYSNTTLAGMTTELARMQAAARAHGRTLYVMARSATPIPWAPGTPHLDFSTVRVPNWPHAIGGPPTGLNLVDDYPVYQIFLGRVGADGTVVAVKPSGQELP